MSLLWCLGAARRSGRLRRGVQVVMRGQLTRCVAYRSRTAEATETGKAKTALTNTHTRKLARHDALLRNEYFLVSIMPGEAYALGTTLGAAPACRSG